MKWIDCNDDGGEDRCSRRKVGYEVEEEKVGGGRRRKEREEQLGQNVAWECSVADWLSGQCGVLDFHQVNQGFWRHGLTISSPSLKSWQRSYG